MTRRVLYLNHTEQMSGGEHSLMLLLGGLPDDVVPVVASPEGRLSEACRTADVPWVPMTGTSGSLKLHPVHTAAGVGDIFRAALETRRACEELSVDLVHANSIRAGLVASIARRLGAPPSVAHIRDVLPPSRVTALAGRLLAWGVDMLIANSAYTRDHLPLQVARGRTRVVHNPVDLGRFCATAADPGGIRAELGLAPETALLAVVAQITPWKGQDTAIRALEKLVGRGYDVHLAFVGSAKFVDKATRYDNEAFLGRLQALVAELGLVERVSFLGEREDVPAIMAATDVLLMPSWQEPFGRAIIEAMAVGTAVVATAVGGTGEIIEDGRNGLLVPPREVDRWVGALAPLLDDPGARERLGQAGKERARDFAVCRHVEAVLDVYAEVASDAA